MKKRFIKRATRPYLLNQLPENLFPHEPLGQAERRKLAKSHSFSGRPGDGKEKGLFSAVTKEMVKVRHIANFHQKKRWSEIDTLEQGSSADNPFVGKVGTHTGTPSSTSHRDAEYDGTTEYLHSILEIKGGIARQDRDRSSTLLQQITERRKIRILYGNLSNKELDILALTASAMRGEKSQNMLKLLESRLDVVLYRVCFFPSIKIAQQWIRRGCHAINGRVETVAARMLTPGDVITPTRHLLQPISVYLKNYWRTSVEGGHIVAAPHRSLMVNGTQETNVKKDKDVFPFKKVTKLANRPLHIEVSYRSLSIVYLCHTQNLLLPATLDMAQGQRAYTE